MSLLMFLCWVHFNTISRLLGDIKIHKQVHTLTYFSKTVLRVVSWDNKEWRVTDKSNTNPPSTMTEDM